ncbi:MAG: hypothetical protein QOF21_2958, partial [Actinomycetota bacterium]
MFFGVFEIIPLLVIGGVLVALFAGRSEPDPDRERPTALYLSIVSFFAVLFLLGASLAVATGLMGLTSDDSGGWSSYGRTTIEVAPTPFDEESGSVTFEPGPNEKVSFGRYRANHDDDVSTLVTGLIVGLLAAGVFRSFFGKARALGASSSGPGARVLARYCYAVCGVTLLGALGGAGVAIRSLFGVIAPDTFDAGSNAQSARVLAVSAVFAIAAYALFRLHSQQARGF